MNKKISFFCLTILLIISIPTTVFGNGIDNSVFNEYEDEKPKTEQPEKETAEVVSSDEELGNNVPSVGIFDFLKMILALFFVLALIYLALKLINKRNKLLGGRGIENIGGASLGNNKSLQLVKVGNSILVVGVGDSINLLKEITDEEEQEKIIQSYQDRIESNGIHTNSLPGFVKKWNQKKVENKQTSFSSLLQEQIGQLSKERQQKMKEWEKKEGHGK
ncbi:flagellar biosynthetic protein FliO [Sutcliffiella rhizosphaerae]|uniref:flagellar biosynthetic protein FliO n=1 Tax=Sutcliffiella rhizosphaerae TaxID=2880967 RepID=UPI001E363CB0|nr:flagellar biosynthetic protein FliO [Sutcliffiella rhizosphaerae]